MAQGRINGTTANQYIVAMLDWQETATDLEGNRSRVRLGLKYSRTNTGYTTYGNWSGSITVNGTTYTDAKFLPEANGIKYNSETELMSVEVWIVHNADGTMTLNLSATGQMSSGTMTSTTLYGTAVLDAIPRATTPTITPATQVMGDDISIDLSGRATNTFTHTLTYEFGTITGTIATKTANTSVTWTVPLNLANAIPNATSGAGTIYCQTYSGNTLVGTTSVSFSASVDASIAPTISAVTIADTNPTQYSAMQGFVQGKSSADVTITAAGAYGSSIIRITTSINNRLFSGANFNTGTLNNSGTLPYTVTVTDSRGMSATYSNSIVVYPYTAPIVSSVTATRCNAQGVADDEGNRIKISASAEFASVGRNNTLYYYVSYRQSGQTTWYYAIGQTSIPNTSSPARLTLTDVVLAQTFNADTTYDIRVVVWDYWTENAQVYQTATVATIAYIMDISPDGDIAFGKVSEYPGMEIAMPGTAPQMTAGKATADNNGNAFITQPVTSGVVTGTYGASITYQCFMRYGRIAVLTVHLETTEQMVGGVVFHGDVIPQAKPSTGFLNVPGGGYVYESGVSINAYISSGGTIEVRSTGQLPANKDFYISFTYIVA